MHNYAGGKVPPYQDTAGTSPACAIVSGVASLVWSRNTKLPAAALKDILVDTADWFPGPGGSFPRVNAGEAVRAARRPWLWGQIWLEFLRSLTRRMRVRPP